MSSSQRRTCVLLPPVIVSTSEVGASNSFQFVFLDGNYHTYPNGSNYPVVMANLLWPFFEGEKLP